MQRRTIARASAILSATLLMGCTAPPPQQQVGQVVGFSEFSGYFHVAKTGPNGTVIVCTYYNASRPGEHFEPRGCEELPAQ